MPNDECIENAQYYGEYAYAYLKMPFGQLIESEFSPGPELLFRTRYFAHSWLWDRQAAPGTATEVVLEQITTEGFREHAALLMPAHKPGKQSLVIRDDTDAWVAPTAA